MLGSKKVSIVNLSAHYHACVQFLDGLLDLEADLDGYGAENEEDKGHLRLSASKALLRSGFGRMVGDAL
jgi:hypothetical protein